MIALHEARRAKLFAPRAWARNVVSGMIVGIVALPRGLAFAIAAGVRPETGGGRFAAWAGGAVGGIAGAEPMDHGKPLLF